MLQELFNKCVDNLYAMKARAGGSLLDTDGNLKFVCSYSTPEGAKCIIGQLLSDEDAALIEKNFPGKSVAELVYIVDKEILNKYPFFQNEKAVRLLSDMQTVHDYQGNWDNRGFVKTSWLTRISAQYNLNSLKVRQIDRIS